MLLATDETHLDPTSCSPYAPRRVAAVVECKMSCIGRLALPFFTFSCPHIVLLLVLQLLVSTRNHFSFHHKLLSLDLIHLSLISLDTISLFIPSLVIQLLSIHSLALNLFALHLY